MMIGSSPRLCIYGKCESIQKQIYSNFSRTILGLVSSTSNVPFLR